MQVVYNEFINDRHHVHMNSTNFLTLTDFVKHLGREGICRVDETPKGWFISLIMKDPMQNVSDERRIKRARHEKARPGPPLPLGTVTPGALTLHSGDWVA